jgi:superfamily II DNA or RNA helicase
MAANGGGQIAGKLSEKAQLLLIQRSRIVKKASEKILALETMLQSISHLEHALIYCEDEDQLNQVSTVLNKLSIRYHRFTGRESTKPNDQYQGASERESLIRSLADGSVQALVAIKCLDEGVDVPSARTAFILASSGSPREFIQRRGRVLRRTPGKEIATIVDFLVVPSDEYVVYDPSERKIFVTECRRLRELCSSALNRLNVEVQLTKLLEIYGV